MEHYDVIVIGSGAGGGTLAHRLAPSGKRILLLERGDWLAREPQNWLAEDVFVDGPLHVEGHLARRPTESPSSRRSTTTSAGATKLYGAALYRLRAEDFGELRHHDGISPAWPISYEQMEPYYTQAEQLYQVHGARGEDPTEPRHPLPTRIPPSPTSRASRSSRRTSPRAATTRSTLPAGCCWTSPTCPTAPACAARTATASPAWCTPRATPR